MVLLTEGPDTIINISVLIMTPFLLPLHLLKPQSLESVAQILKFQEIIADVPCILILVISW